MIEFACPSCNKAMRVDDTHMGRQGKCPKCGHTVKVPDRSTLIEFMCGRCGHWIRVGEHYAGKQGKCPKCKHPVVVPQQEPVSEVGSSESPDTGQEIYEEPAARQAAQGSDRRRAIMVVGVVLVGLVGVIGLLVWFHPWTQEPAATPVVTPATPETVAIEPPRPASDPNAAPVKQAVTPVVSQANRLQFSPGPGDRRTLRVTMTTQYVMSAVEGGPTQDITGVQSITVKLEPGQARPEGTIPVQVTLTRIQAKTVMQGITQVEYDSARLSAEDNPDREMYAPFVGKHFTISVSGQGQILDPGLDTLFSTVAQERVQAEDDNTRERLREKAERVIERTDQGFGSRQGRLLAMKRKLETFPVFGKGEIRSLLGHLTVFLPAQTIRRGAGWKGPLALRVGTYVEMPVRYTVTALDEDTCTIEAQGTRGVEDEPFVYQSGQVKVTSKLAGTSQVKLVVERRTGWLRHKQQKTSLNGQIIQGSTEDQGTQTPIDTRMEITTTVEPFE